MDGNASLLKNTSIVKTLEYLYLKEAEGEKQLKLERPHFKGFVDYFDDKVVDRDEEKEILQTAISIGIGVDEARGKLKSVCLTHEYVLESDVDEKATEILTQFASNDGKIDKKEKSQA